MAHTPKPWERLVGECLPGHTMGVGRAVVRIVSKRAPDETAFRRIALVDSDHPFEDGSLISAAPDLLEALSFLMARGSVLNALEDDERENILATIARAKGETE